MITRRTLEGALKCALRDFRREEATAVVENPISKLTPNRARQPHRNRGIS